jgi:hypothetical protein
MKEYGGLNSTRKGKGRDESLEKGVKLEGLSKKEYYNIINKGYGEDNYFILSSNGKVNETRVKRSELEERHVSSRAYVNISGKIILFSHPSPFTQESIFTPTVESLHASRTPSAVISYISCYAQHTRTLYEHVLCLTQMLLFPTQFLS